MTLRPGRLPRHPRSPKASLPRASPPGGETGSHLSATPPSTATTGPSLRCPPTTTSTGGHHPLLIRPQTATPVSRPLTLLATRTPSRLTSPPRLARHPGDLCSRLLAAATTTHTQRTDQRRLAPRTPNDLRHLIPVPGHRTDRRCAPLLWSIHRHRHQAHTMTSHHTCQARTGS
jgi:hypothetical protein